VRWKYVNARRSSAFIERSIDGATQWVVFEPNALETWVSVQPTIEHFLCRQWFTRAFFGAKP
jgi:phage tail sheath protein FI